MTKHLPPSLLALFAPRPPVPYLPAIEKTACPPYEGISDYVQFFEDPSTVDYSKFTKVETRKQKRERKKKEKKENKEKEIQEKIRQWDPQENSNATGDAYKTLFVSRINFQTSETKLKREFELYGPIKKIRMIKDKDGKPRGYAFIEYERERDMKAAFKAADGKKIDGRRVLVDVERGRTVKNWTPRKFGGGLGGTRLGGDDVNQKFSGREPPTLSAPPAAGGKPRSDGRGNRDRNFRDDHRMDHHRDHHDHDHHHHHHHDYDHHDHHRGGRMERERYDPRAERGMEHDRGMERGDRYERGRGDRGDRGDRERDRGDRGDRDHKKRRRSRSRSPRESKRR